MWSIRFEYVLLIWSYHAHQVHWKNFVAADVWIKQNPKRLKRVFPKFIPNSDVIGQKNLPKQGIYTMVFSPSLPEIYTDDSFWSQAKFRFVLCCFKFRWVVAGYLPPLVIWRLGDFLTLKKFGSAGSRSFKVEAKPQADSLTFSVYVSLRLR